MGQSSEWRLLLCGGWYWGLVLMHCVGSVMNFVGYRYGRVKGGVKGIGMSGEEVGEAVSVEDEGDVD